MLLAIDVGNTNITVGVFEGDRLASRGRISSSSPRTVDEYAMTLRGLLQNMEVAREHVDGVIISSVVPRATAALKQAFKGLVRPKPWVVGESVRAPVVNKYRVPGQVGQDRLVNAAAAFHFYGGPAVVVDFGTAVTLDLVNRRREYLGGLILPGLEIALEALATRTALLPRIELTPPKEFLGRDTQSSMRSGLFHGYGALCDGLIASFRREYGRQTRVIATGGHAAMIAPFCRSIRIINPDLTLQGLLLTYRQKSY